METWSAGKETVAKINIKTLRRLTGPGGDVIPVHFSNNNAGVVHVLLPKLVPDGCLQCLSAHGHHVEILADQNLHTSCVPVLGNLLGHLVLLQLSSKQLGNRVFDVLCLNLIVVRLELGHVLTQLDGPEGGQLRL